MIPMGVTKHAYSTPWEGWTMHGTHTEHHWKNHRTQSSPPSFTQHTWNLFWKTPFYDAGLWIDRTWGHKFDECFKQLCREVMATRQVFSSTLCHHFQRQPICRAHAWGQFRPRCKSRYVDFETRRAQFTSLQRCWTFGSCENQCFHWDTQHVTSSGSHAGTLWPLAISQTITSQPRLILWASQHLQNRGMGIPWRHETLGSTSAVLSQDNFVLKQPFCLINKLKSRKQLMSWHQILPATWIRSWHFWNVKSWYNKKLLLNASLSSRHVSPSWWDASMMPRIQRGRKGRN